LKKEEDIFEEKFKMGYVQMKKSMIMDDFEKLRSSKMTSG